MFSKDRQCEDASPNTPSPSNVNKSFLTPCRRMGLKRMSPASSNQKPNKKQLVATNEEGICKTYNLCDDLSGTPSSSKSETPKRKMPRNNFCSQSGDHLHSFLSRSPTNNSSIIDESNQFKSIVINSSCDNTEMLKKRIAEKERQLHCLKQAVIYRKKHDITKLAEMVIKWKTGCQDALCELLSETKERGFELNMVQLLNQLRIPHELVGYNKNIDEFE